MALNIFTNAFTGSPYKQSGQQIRSYLSGLQSEQGANLGGAQTGALESLYSGQTGALGALQSGYGQAQNYVQQYTPQALQALYGMTEQGANALATGQSGALSALQGGVNQAVGAYAPVNALGQRFASAGSAAQQASFDALGLNGPEGIARAKASFQAGPGYGFAVDQGLNAISRNAAASGMAASGNQLQESQKFGQGLANQEFGKYQQNLYGQQGLYEPLASSTLQAGAQGTANAYLAGGTGAANIYTGTAGRLASLYGGAGTTGAGILSGAGNTLAELAARGGAGQAGVYGQTGQGAAEQYGKFAGLRTGLAGQLAQQYGNTYNAQAAAENMGSANFWNLLGNAAKFATGKYGQNQGGQGGGSGGGSSGGGQNWWTALS